MQQFEGTTKTRIVVKHKIVMILSRFPYPLDKGDKLRAYHQLLHMSKSMDIHLVCITTQRVMKKDIDEVMPYIQSLKLYPCNLLQSLQGIIYALQNKFPLQVGFFYQKKRVEEIQEYIKNIAPSYVYCQLSRTALYGKFFKGYNIVDMQDAFSANYLRSISKSTLLKKWFFKREYSTMCAFEENMLQWFSYCTIISQFDKNQINADAHNLMVVPNGVDTSFFAPIITEKKYDILFVGNMSYEPNILAAKYIYEKIIPTIVKIIPNIRVCIAGAHATKACKNMLHNNLQILGYSPDIREVYLSAKIFIAPLFTGAGMQNKILEAMSLALPCVTTTLVNSSIMATHSSQILIADTVSGFCEHVQKLLQHKELQNEIGQEARKYIVENFQWDIVNEKLSRLFT